jgi:hypothetical protein
MWTHNEAVELCKLIEPIAQQYGAHVALSGGLLYKEGERKDCDLVFYRHRQARFLDKTQLLEALRAGRLLYMANDYGFCVKAWSDFGTAVSSIGRSVDLLFPETHPSLMYPHDGELDAARDVKPEDWLTLVR